MKKNESLVGIEYSLFLVKCKAGLDAIHEAHEKYRGVELEFSSPDALSHKMWTRLVVEESNTVRMHFFYKEHNMTVRDFNKYAKLLLQRASSGSTSANPEPVSPSVPQARLIKSTVAKMKKSLIGCDQQYEEFIDAVTANDKAIMLAGSHGLGKSEAVKDVARYFDAQCTRIQVSAMTSEIDLIGSTDPNTGKFLKGAVYRAVEDAISNPSQMHFLFFDEFTRGTDEAMTAIFPLVAEKRLIVNNPHAPVSELIVANNLVIVGTGNVDDKGLRNLGGAEFDRWRVIDFEHITDTEILRRICKDYLYNSEAFTKITTVYALSIQYAKERKILPMSIRTMISTMKLAKIKYERGYAPLVALRKALDNDYWASSQAFYNPSYKNTYMQIMREVGLGQ
jgi:hypothetical protein